MAKSEDKNITTLATSSVDPRRFEGIFEIINFKELANYKEHNFFCSHGIFDQVIPIEIGRKSSEMMSKYGINHKFLEFQSSHGICPENFEQMILWLENN